MTTKFVLLWLMSTLLSVSMMASTGNGEKDALLPLLNDSPLWGKTFGASDIKSELARMDHIFRMISGHRNEEIHDALQVYLDEGKSDPIMLSYRLDNAKLVCLFTFNIPKEHPWGVYLDSAKTPSLQIAEPSFMATINRGRSTGQASIDSFWNEFWRIAEDFGRRDAQVNHTVTGESQCSDISNKSPPPKK